MENKLTPEESTIAAEISAELARQELNYENPSFCLGAQAMFNYMWPHVKEGLQHGYAVGRSRGVKDFSGFIATTLDKLKRVANEIPSIKKNT